MLTSKERSLLSGLAAKEKAIFQIGKDGIGDQTIRGISLALDARELVKITVLKTAEEETVSIAEKLSVSLEAETVKIIGNKIIFYRLSRKKGVEHILKPEKK